MTVKIKKTYKYIKYLFGAYALYMLIGGVMKTVDNQEPAKDSLASLYAPIDTVYADVPQGDGCGDGGSSDCDGGSGCE